MTDAADTPDGKRQCSVCQEWIEKKDFRNHQSTHEQVTALVCLATGCIDKEQSVLDVATTNSIIKAKNLMCTLMINVSY